MKEKPCKGINKAASFSGCGKLSVFRKYGLCPKCLWQWMNTTKEGDEYKKNSFYPMVSKKTSTTIKKREKEIKNNYTDWRMKLQKKIQEIARLVDIGQPCLARGNHPNQIHGGHIFSRGGNSQIALNLHNIHRQGAQSNHFQNDDGLLRDGLKNEYGENYFTFISSLRECGPLTYSNIEYSEFYKKACKICNDLKKQGEIFSKEGRIKKRNEINLLLGIYDKKYCVYAIPETTLS